MDKIDLTPTWSGLLPALIMAIECGTQEGRQMATKELASMARAADAYNALVKGQNKPGALSPFEEK